MTVVIQYRRTGGPEVLERLDVPDPFAEPGHVTVRMESIGVNPIDWKLRSGLRGGEREFEQPRGVGADGAGIITGVGEGVDGFTPGDPVVVAGIDNDANPRAASGTYATEIAVDVSRVWARPAGVSAQQGAALGIPAGTAYQSLRSLGVGEGDSLLIHGGSGAVGQFAIQFATLMGARVTASCSEARADRVSELGATPVRYGPTLLEEVRGLGDPPSVILDCAGTEDALAASLELGVDRSRIATIVAGARASELGIRASSGGSPRPLTAQQSAWRLEAVPVALALLAAGTLSVELGAVYTLAEAGEAQEAVRSGVSGKVTLEPYQRPVP